MKQKEKNLVKEVGERSFLFPKDELATIEKGFAMNETSRFIWDLLTSEQTEDNIIEIVSKEYCVDKATAQEDVKYLLNAMLEAGVIK